MADEIIKDVEDVNSKLDDIRSLTETYFSGQESLETMTESMEAVSAGKLDVALAFGLASLYFVMLNANGKSNRGTDAGHPIISEIGRIKQYVQRVNALEAKLRGEPVISSASLRVDKEAASRIVAHNLSSSGSSNKKRPKLV